MKMNINKIIEKHGLKIIMFLQLVISIVIFSIRYFAFDKIMIGNTSYFHAIKARELLTNTISFVNYRPYQFILSLFSRLFNDIDLASQILPIILSLISIILLYLMLKKLKINHRVNFTTCLLMIISPIYIYISNISNQYILSVLIILLLFYLFLKIKKSNTILPFFLIIPFLGIFETIFSSALLLILQLRDKNNKNKRPIMLTILAMLILLFYFPIKNFDIVQNNEFILKFITGFGAYLGFSVFSLILFIIGIIFTWNNKRRLIPIYSLILFLFLVFIYFGQYSNVFLNFFICFFGAVALTNLIDYKWNLDVVRDLTIIVLICGLLFTTISYTNRLSRDMPDEHTRSITLKIGELTPENSIILTVAKNSFYVHYFANRKTISDIHNPNEDENVIFGSREFLTVTNLLDKNKVDYIYISPDMRQELWTSDEDGLLFLLPFEERFRMRYRQKGHEIWKVIDNKK